MDRAGEEWVRGFFKKFLEDVYFSKIHPHHPTNPPKVVSKGRGSEMSRFIYSGSISTPSRRKKKSRGEWKLLIPDTAGAN